MKIKETSLFETLVASTIAILLTSLPAQACSSLCECNTVYYAYCMVRDIDDTSLAQVLRDLSPSVLELDLSGNLLTSLPSGICSNLPNLEYLNLAGNSIRTINQGAFFGLHNLRDLTLHKNQLSNLNNDTFAGLRKLRYLHLGDNRISSIPAGTFQNLPDLEKLSLQKNNLTRLGPDVFEGLTSLRILNLSHNGIRTIESFTFSRLASMRNLDVSNNGAFYKFHQDSFNPSMSLQKLYLQDNSISDLAFLKGLSVTSVFLANNDITSILPRAFEGVINVKHIDLSQNRIRQLGDQAFFGLELDLLSLTNNNLAVIDRDGFRGAKRISSLNLSSNAIQDIKTGAFNSIRNTILSIDLRNNQMSYIHSGMFRRMGKLRKLFLGANNISVLDTGSFQDLRSLFELDLSSNRFQVFTSDMMSGPSQLQRLRLVCNPLRRIEGFSFSAESDRMYIETNSTVESFSQNSVTLSWPFTQGSHLYWTLSITCLSSPVVCQVPAYQSTLKPYSASVTVRDLSPGSDYFMCIVPVFLSPHVEISQCVRVRTSEQIPSDDDAVDASVDSNNQSSKCCLSSLTLLLQLWALLMWSF